VVAESMRLYPPAWVVGRRMRADAVLDGWTVPAGSIVAGSQWVTHRDARWWSEPLRFVPTRWIGPDGAFDEAAPGQPRGAYFPFGLGRRVCVGESFAWTEAMLVLAALARDWAPSLVPGTPVDVRPGVTLRPDSGLPMTLARRA
jgi:cytochrome P450